MRHLGIVASSINPAAAPSVSVSSVTNYNQSIATFNGTVSANGAITTQIKFQYSPDGGLSWFDASGGTTITNTSSQSVSVYYNATGLSAGVGYLVKLIATNSVGTSESENTSFTTWALKSHQVSTVGTTSLSIPTVTPTGGSAIVPSIYNVFVAAGGGGAYSISAGGGGGVSTASSRAFNNASDLSLSIVVGGGGAGSTSSGSAGGSSSISGSSITTLSATGGNAGGGGYTSSGSSGNGYAAGSGSYYYDPGSGQTPIPTESYAAGGGGGAGGAGANGDAPNFRGGNGGTGVYSSTFSVGAGGGGGGGATENSVGSTAIRGNTGTYNTYGAGGSGGTIVDEAWSDYPTSGGGGYVGFQYYGPP